MYCSHVLTPYGYVFVYAVDRGVVKVEIPDMGCIETDRSDAPSELEPSGITTQAAQLLQGYFHGDPVDFSAIPVVLDGMTQFRQKVLTAIRTLGFGEIRSYRQVAELCGAPGAARAVGGALAANPVPIIIPCHRVVASNGRLTGFSAPGGEGTKRVLLQMEHVEFKGMLAVVPGAVMHRQVAR